MKRRAFLASLGAAGLSACGHDPLPEAPAAEAWPTRWLAALAGKPTTGYDGGWIGQRVDRGHALRDGRLPDAIAETRRSDVLVIGAGISGLAAARALRAAGITELRVLELDDVPGGNSRGGVLGGMACPLGAHYLPTPGPQAEAVAALLDELGLRRRIGGQILYDERALCAAPEERLWIAGRWQEGLLPPPSNAQAADDYRRFAEQVRAAQAQPLAFTMPTSASRWSDALAALDAQPFAQWLTAQGLHSAELRSYLDYCCRDDYGAGLAQVSAWAGLHYFASRHGFTAPGDPDAGRDAGRDEVLTWPEGNGWLARRLAEPLAGQIDCGVAVARIAQDRSGVTVDALDSARGVRIRWQAQAAVIALPLFIAARLLADPPAALREAAAQQPHAPWLVANLLLDGPLAHRRGEAPLAWDNVLHGAPGLGYVNARNQIPEAFPQATVLTYYRALGDDPAAGRRALLQRDWRAWAEDILSELSGPHPDLRQRLRRVELMRYGHAMAIPAPGLRGSAALAALRAPQGRLAFAHADLSAYSVFEEAYGNGLAAGRQLAARLRGRAIRTSPPR